MKHIRDTVGCQRCACYGIYRVGIIAVALLQHGDGDGIAISTLEKFLALELLLPLLVVLDFGTQSGSLAVVVEVCAEDGVLVLIKGIHYLVCAA